MSSVALAVKTDVQIVYLNVRVHLSEDRLPVVAGLRSRKRFDKPTNCRHVLLRHRLPPFPGEAFGGRTGLVDVGVVRELNAVVVQRGAMHSFFAPDGVWDMSPLGMGTFEGRAAIRAFLEDWQGAYGEFGVEAEEVLDLRISSTRSGAVDSSDIAR